MKEIVNQIRKNLYKIANEVGFKDIREYPHNEWMDEIIFGESDYTLMSHRGSYKSSALSVCIALIMVLMPWFNIIFLRKADNDVTEMIKMVKKALESRVIQNISIALWKRELKIIESTASSITTNLYYNSSGASQLLGIGLKSSITGKHADIVITDDICNITDRISKAERDRTKLQYQELQNIKNRGGRIINLGTKWHQDDVFTLMDNINIYDYLMTGLISDEEIKRIKEKMLPSLFACNYELKIIASEDVIFSEPKKNADRSKAEQGICHVDAAYGGEDLTSFTIGRKEGNVLYLYGRCWHKHVDDCQDEIVKLRKSFNAGKIYCEDNGDKGYLAKELRNKGERVVKYHEDMNKFLKITTYLKGVWNDVIFIEGTDEEYINQICDYNENAEHDDCPDSASSIARLLYKKKGNDDKSETYSNPFM